MCEAMMLVSTVDLWLWRLSKWVPKVSARACAPKRSCPLSRMAGGVEEEAGLMSWLRVLCAMWGRWLEKCSWMVVAVFCQCWSASFLHDAVRRASSCLMVRLRSALVCAGAGEAARSRAVWRD